MCNNLFNSYYSSDVNYIFDLSYDNKNNIIVNYNNIDFLLKKVIFLDFDNSEDILNHLQDIFLNNKKSKYLKKIKRG